MSVLLLIISAAAAAQSRTLTAQDLEELDAIDRQLAPSACEGMKLYIEAIAAAGVGDAAKAQEVEARMAKAQRPPELVALARRKNELLSGATVPPGGMGTYLEARQRREAECPWRKVETPYDLPRAKDAAEARDYAVMLVPNFFVGWRLCELFFPERRSQAQAAWQASPLSRIAIPEYRRAMDDVLGWLPDGLAPPAPGSLVDRSLKDPLQRGPQQADCDGKPQALKRIEAAFPPEWLAAGGPSH